MKCCITHFWSWRCQHQEWLYSWLLKPFLWLTLPQLSAWQITHSTVDVATTTVTAKLCFWCNTFLFRCHPSCHFGEIELKTVTRIEMQGLRILESDGRGGKEMMQATDNDGPWSVTGVKQLVCVGTGSFILYSRIAHQVSRQVLKQVGVRPAQPIPLSPHRTSNDVYAVYIPLRRSGIHWLTSS